MGQSLETWVEANAEIKCDRHHRLTDVFVMPKIALHAVESRFDDVNFRLLASPNRGS